jgi:hypothetical protein
VRIRTSARGFGANLRIGVASLTIIARKASRQMLAISIAAFT